MVTIYVEAILGLLLLFAWAQNTAIHANLLVGWGFAHLIRAGSVVLFGMYGSALDLITIDLANALMFTRLRRHLDGRARLRRAPGGAGLSGHRRRALAAGLPPAGTG